MCPQRQELGSNILWNWAPEFLVRGPAAEHPIRIDSLVSDPELARTYGEAGPDPVLLAQVRIAGTQPLTPNSVSGTEAAA